MSTSYHLFVSYLSNLYYRILIRRVYLDDVVFAPPTIRGPKLCVSSITQKEFDLHVNTTNMLTVLNFLVLYIYSNYGSLYHNVVTKRTEFKNIYIFSRCLPSILKVLVWIIMPHFWQICRLTGIHNAAINDKQLNQNPFAFLLSYQRMHYPTQDWTIFLFIAHMNIKLMYCF